MMRISSLLSVVRRAVVALSMIAMAALLSPGIAAAQCAGDCNGDRAVAINELIVGVNIALGSAAVGSCPSFDASGDGSVAINELIAAVNNALSGCPVGGDTPTPTPTVIPTTPATTGPTATATRTPNGSLCGNDTLDTQAGETCDDGNRDEGPGDSCPANCQIATCSVLQHQTFTVDVVLDTTPNDLLVGGATLFIRYPDGTVDVPGNNNDPPVQEAVLSDFFSITPNDSNYGLTTVLLDPFFIGVNEGTAISVAFDLCDGASAPPASRFTCTVIEASGPPPELPAIGDQVTCSVVPR